jgi:phospholipid/cholesterol/gamma-HCH transport system permease protein
MATAHQETVSIPSALTSFGRQVYDGVQAAFEVIGDQTLFAGRTLTWLFRQRLSRGTLVSSFYFVGVRSVPVVAVTGIFVGMVLAVQFYSQFHQLGMATRLGAIINVSIVRELGPVLAATMLAGRVGSAMAAELATMQITEQIDALACLGVHPLHYLVLPRFLACVLLIPLLTIIANTMGVFGGYLICIQFYHIEAHHYWTHSRAYVELWDLAAGLIKPMFFGAAIAMISCYRGFRSKAGAEGVGLAATGAFVHSFIAILVLDLFLAMFLNSLYERIWPNVGATLL